VITAWLAGCIHPFQKDIAPGVTTPASELFADPIRA
jgi:hypothetical protein